MTSEPVDWARAQAALREEVERVVGLLRTARHPEAHAVGRWNLAEVAMHLSQAFLIVPNLARGDLSETHELMPALARREGSSVIGDVWELADLTTAGVDTDPERDLGVLADRIEARAAAFLAEAAAHSADERRPWLVEGTTFPLPVFTCHLLNETIMHGGDIARADGRRWPVHGPHAALVFDGFIWPVIAGLGPRAMVDQEAAAGLRATFDLRARYGRRYRFAFDDGALSIEPPSSGPVDCHIWADPAALLLVAWGRQSQWAAIARGKLLAWGRKPWLGLRFRALMRNP